MMTHFCLAMVFAVVAFGQLSDNVNTGPNTRCNNYIAFVQTSRVGIELLNLYPVGTCYTENNYAEQPEYSFDRNMMYKCEETSNGTLEACQYRMGINCNGEIENTGVCYPCNGPDDQCECEIGGDASECQFYESTRYEGASDGVGQYCNQERAVLTREVVNMCIQGSNDGQGSGYTYNHACGAYSSRTGVRGAMYEYNEGQLHSAADCSDGVTFPTSAPTYSNAPTTSTTLLRLGSMPWCSETTCDGVDSPPADGGTYNPSQSPVTAAPAIAEPLMPPVSAPTTDPTSPVTAEPSMSPIIVSSSTNATLNVLLIILTFSFTF